MASIVATRSYLGVGNPPLAPLAPGQSETVSAGPLSFQTNPPTCHGVAITATADGPNNVAESNEENNSLQVTIP